MAAPENKVYRATADKKKKALPQLHRQM